MANLDAKEYQRFEDIKHTTDEGVEFWYARELAPVLEYAKWANFLKVIDKAMLACQNSGFDTADHFAEVGKMVALGSGSQRKVKDYMLSRYACYLIMQNGDPRKEVIALGQTYFCVVLVDVERESCEVTRMEDGTGGHGRGVHAYGRFLEQVRSSMVREGDWSGFLEQFSPEQLRGLGNGASARRFLEYEHLFDQFILT